MNFKKGYRYSSKAGFCNIFICYNCSDLSSVSGHCCSLMAFYPFKNEEIQDGVFPCFYNKMCGSKFNLYEGEQIENIYKEIESKPMWIVHKNTAKLSDAELKEYEESQNVRKNRKKLDPYSEYLPDDFAVKRITQAKSIQCLEYDPLINLNKEFKSKQSDEDYIKSKYGKK